MSNEVIPSRDFDEVAQMIAAAKQRTYSAVNSMLVELYWQVGAYIHNKLESVAWGEGVVDQLATYLKSTQPGLRGFTRRNLLVLVSYEFGLGRYNLCYYPCSHMAANQCL